MIIIIIGIPVAVLLLVVICCCCGGKKNQVAAAKVTAKTCDVEVVKVAPEPTSECCDKVAEEIATSECCAEDVEGGQDGVHCCNSAVGKKKSGNWKERHRRCFLRSIGIYGGSPELCTLPRTNGGRKATYVAAAGCRALFCLTPSLPRWRWVLSSTSSPINCRRRSLFAIDCH
nr:hypothetical protein Itr_chr06CG02170 [Ipomoea trifida]